LNPVCLKERFVVFNNQIDLQAHQIAIHGESAPKSARRLETGFTYSSQQSRADPRAGGGVSMAPNRHTGASSSAVTSAPSNAVPYNPIPEPVSTSSNARDRIIPGLKRGGFKTNLSEPENTSRKQEKTASTMGDTVTGVKQNDPMMAA
jgi:hypothetical protein